MRPIGLSRRWNYEIREVDGRQEVWVCQGDHGKTEPCEFVRWESPYAAQRIYPETDRLSGLADVTAVQLPHEDFVITYSRCFHAQAVESENGTLPREGMDADFVVVVGWRCQLCRTRIFTSSRILLAEHNKEHNVENCGEDQRWREA